MKYRAIEKIEYVDEKGKSVVVPAGKEFNDPPESANMDELVKHKAVERVTEKKA